MQKKVDYFIVGQGLAGSILALQLMKENKSFHIYDPHLSKSSSTVAAGLINPLVLKRLTLSWKAKEFITYNKTFYPEIEQLIQKKFFHPLPLYKLIFTEDDKYFWKHRFKKKKFIDFMDSTLYPAEKELFLTKNYLKGKVKQASWVDTHKLLNTLRDIFLKNQQLTEKKIDYQKLRDHQYEDIYFKNLVFCEGIAALKNPYFKDFKLIGNKGNLLTIQSDEFYTDSIICKKIFILPIGNQHYKIGSTYDINYIDERADEKQGKYIQTQFEAISKAKYKVINHEAAIRPTVEDRRPLVGRIKEQENYYVFNGLGSRGCLLAPFLAQELLNFIEKGENLTPECNIERFYT